MRVISRKQLKTFWAAHADAEQPLKAWFHEAKVAQWTRFQDIQRRYASADALHGNRVVFNIKGNTYRLVIKIHYNTQIVYIRFIGTHAAYDKVNAATI
jgi:mRNA interferase HigB